MGDGKGKSRASMSPGAKGMGLDMGKRTTVTIETITKVNKNIKRGGGIA